MAYMNQEGKALIATALKAVMPEGWKYSLSVNHHSTIVLTIKSAPVDLIEEAMRVNAARVCAEHQRFTEKPTSLGINEFYLETQFDTHLITFKEILEAMKSANWFDESDSQSDYFHTAYYINISLGKWNKPFVVTA